MEDGASDEDRSATTPPPRAGENGTSSSAPAQDDVFVRRITDAFVESMHPDRLPSVIVDPGRGSVGTIELKHVPNYPATYGPAAIPPEGMTILDRMQWARSQPRQNVLFVKNVELRGDARNRGLGTALVSRLCTLAWIDVVVIESVQNVSWGERLMRSAGFRAAPGFPEGRVTPGGNLYRMCEVNSREDIHPIGKEPAPRAVENGTSGTSSASGGLVETCALCEIPLGPGGAVTRLECRHAYHASCAHGALARSGVRCFACRAQGSSYVSLEVRSVRAPDFGDDWAGSRQAEFERTASDVFETELVSHEQLRAVLESRERADQSARARSEAERRGGGSGARAALSRVAVRLGQRFVEMDDTDRDLALKLERDPLAMVQNGMSAREMLRRGVDGTSLVRREIEVRTMLEAGYDLRDLVLLGTTWQNLLEMRLTPEVWRDHMAALPVRDVKRVYNVNVHTIFTHVCGRRMARLASMGISAKDMADELGANAQILYEMGMRKGTMMTFRYTMIEWTGTMGLTFALLRTLAIDRADLSEGLQWLASDDPKSEQSDAKRFAEQFGGHEPTELTHESSAYAWG